MQGQPGFHPHQHIRFYIIMITLVIGGIFFLLIMNNGNDLSFTGALVGDSSESDAGVNDSPSKKETLGSEDVEPKTTIQEKLRSKSIEYEFGKRNTLTPVFRIATGIFVQLHRGLR